LRFLFGFINRWGCEIEMERGEDLRDTPKCASPPQKLDIEEDEDENPECAKWKDEPDSQDVRDETKITGEEIEPQDSEDASRTNPELFAAPPSTSFSHRVIAPRTATFMPPSQPYTAQNFPSSGEDATRVSAPGMNTFDEEPSSEVYAQMSRSERKRYREKKRRSEVNKGFDDLLSVLLRVNPSLRAELEEGEKCTNSRRSQRSSSIDGDHSLALNRVDLISRTIETLEMIYREKEESEARASEISQASNDFAAARQAIKDDRVLLMVPFLSPVAGSTITRQSADSTASTSQQQSRGLQAVLNQGGLGASYQFPPTGQQGLQATGFTTSGFGSQIQGDLRDSIRFNQGYLQAMHDGANHGSGLSLGRQEAKSQRGRMR
jgi:hypothetical protein